MFGSRPPQKDRRGRFWDWVNPALGKERNCWLVGDIVGVETHWLGRTQPCRHYLTNGRMKCYCQTSNLGVEWKGYIPLLDENAVQCFAIIGERFADLAYSMHLFSRVTVSRLRSAGAPVCVKESDQPDGLFPFPETHKRKRDIRPWLLKLWGDESLNEWFSSHGNQEPAKCDTLNESMASAMVKEVKEVLKERSKLPARGGAPLPGMPAPVLASDVIAHHPSQNWKKGR